MSTFDDFSLSKPLRKALAELGFERPRRIQEKAFPRILSGSDMVGIAQTGTGKTLAYLLPVLQMLPFSKEKQPRALILVPTRELVVQVVDEIEKFATHTSLKAVGVYGGTNINRQKEVLATGTDIVVATPGRLYDLMLCGALKTKAIKKLVIDEVDVMLDLGFRFQLSNILDLLPKRRQNILFSATMTEGVDVLIQHYFQAPKKITIAVSGTPLESITQQSYAVPNFYTKCNLLIALLNDSDRYTKVLVFTRTKKAADRVFHEIDAQYGSAASVVHSNKTQNYRLRAIEGFENGTIRILVTTDIMARGLDFDTVSHVINFDTPLYPENYIHRIGRTGRAAKKGNALLFHTEAEQAAKEAIEALMQMKIPRLDLPKDIEISAQLTPEETPKIKERENLATSLKEDSRGTGFHEKKEKNKRTNQGGSYKRNIKKKYKKAKTRGDKNYNKRNKRR